MCRFLLIKSKETIQPNELLHDFAAMCKNNTDWQGDGWGIAFKTENTEFYIQKSLKPIWEDVIKFDSIPPSNVVAVHARGASFPHQKGEIAYNQPFVDGELCFVFNGELYGVKIKADGKIGAQKIFSLLKEQLQIEKTPDLALQKTGEMLLNRSKSILGCNIAFYLDSTLYAQCNFSDKKEYYTLRYYSDNNLSIICSEEIGYYKWNNMQNGTLIQL